MKFTATVFSDGGLFVAQCLEVDVASQGATVDEATANLREALELYFEDKPANDRPQSVIKHIEIAA